MGLDMYAWSVAKNDGNGDFSIAEDVERREFAYWRKFNALHGWMEDVYRSMGGNETFNCVPMRLTPDILDELEYSCKNNELKPTQGFFFGAQEVYPEDIEDTLTFINNARNEIESGREVYYDSWW